jgi:curved DNA-binding protein CbpA
MNPFEILEVPADATPDDIRAAYHRLAKQWHPDRFKGEEKAQAELKFRQVADAFNQLKDPLKRQAFAVSASKPASAAAPAETQAAPPPPAKVERKAEDWAADARQAANDGDLDRARGLIQYAIRMDGSKADFHLQLADVLEAGGDVRGAIRALESAHKLRPREAEILIRLADHFGSLGMQARQMRYLEDAKAIAPNHKRFKAPAEGKMQAEAQAAGGLMDQVKGLLNKLLKKG